MPLKYARGNLHSILVMEKQGITSSKKEDRLNELQQQYNLILRYYPDTVFIQDMDDKMKKVNSELEKINIITANIIK